MNVNLFCYIIIKFPPKKRLTVDRGDGDRNDGMQMGITINRAERVKA